MNWDEMSEDDTIAEAVPVASCELSTTVEDDGELLDVVGYVSEAENALRTQRSKMRITPVELHSIPRPASEKKPQSAGRIKGPQQPSGVAKVNSNLRGVASPHTSVRIAYFNSDYLDNTNRIAVVAVDAWEIEEAGEDVVRPNGIVTRTHTNVDLTSDEDESPGWVRPLELTERYI